MFKTEQSRPSYTLIFPEHTNAREHVRNKLVALASDSHSLESDNISLQLPPKRKRTREMQTDLERCTDYSIHPSYVEYEGHFHVAEFLSLQQGNVYLPGMSRPTQWIECSRNDFYEKVFDIIRPQHVASGVYLNDVLPLWIPSEGLRVGKAGRIVLSPSLKSCYPIFEWRSDTDKKEKVEGCVDLAEFARKSSDDWELHRSTQCVWCNVGGILKVVGAADEDTGLHFTVCLLF